MPLKVICYIFLLAAYTETVVGQNREQIDVRSEMSIIRSWNAEPLLAKIKDKRITILAEKYHDQRTPYLVKNYIVEQLLTEKEAIAFLIEGNIYEYYYVERVLDSITSLNISLFFSDVYLASHAGYNLWRLAKAEKFTNLQLYGFDYHIRNSRNVRDLLNDLRAADTSRFFSKDEMNFIEKQLLHVTNYPNGVYLSLKLLDSISFFTSKAELFYRNLAERNSYTENARHHLLHGRMWHCIFQHFADVYERSKLDSEKIFNEDFKEITKYNVRDKFLFDNLSWLIDSVVDPSLRILVSISSLHAARKFDFTKYVSKGFLPVGQRMSSRYAGEYYSVAILPGAGSRGLVLEQKNTKIKKNSLEGKLFKNKEQVQFIDLAQWCKSHGKFYMSPFLGRRYLKAKWDEYFDGVIFLHHTTANSLVTEYK